MTTVIAVDFDGTCVVHKYPRIGRDAPYAVEKLKKYVSKGIRLILLTMRCNDALDDAIDWFKRNGIELWAINENPEQSAWTSSPKVHADIYIDDCGIGTPLIRLEEGLCVDWKAVDAIVESIIT